ncbi:MAG: bifunctional oligoribonuclease/PAP phosphatase NrnA [Synergistaceae bacterium]|jgi:phosphoesterase RecJ-like protein|nr:bifunctional oligoribonuclease/PAP phosphatase NrnA [Synergistaceae bacterium]
MNKKPVAEVMEILSSKGKWLVLMHEKADGDTTGCAVAIASLGTRLGRDVTLAGPDPFPSRYSFLLGGMPYCQIDVVPEKFFGDDCVVICVDTSNAERSIKGLSAARSKVLIVNIDHHDDNSKYGDVNWIDGSSSATGEMVTELMSSSEWGITPQEANSLYTAIVTDNGHFSFPSSTAKSHERAVELLEAGASPGMMAEELESNMTEGALKLWSRAFSRVALFAGGLCAFFWLTKLDFEETLSTRQDTENLVNFLLRIRGVRLAALCTELGDGVRVSLRARFPLSAHEIAVSLGGGGHNLASGCTIREPLDDALKILRTEMERHAETSFSAG